MDKAGAAKTFTYDANGNMTSDGTRTFEWDARNQLVAVNVGTHRTEFVYDGLQRRVREIEKENGVVQSDTHVLWCEIEICEERAADGTAVTRRSLRHGEQVGVQTRFFTVDHLGSVREVTNPALTTQGRYLYDPWGRRSLSAGAAVTSVGFTGHYDHDGMALAQFRSYSPDLGRSISQDPLGLRASRNLHAYVENRPIRLFDPFGLQSVTTKDCVSSQAEQLKAAYAKICRSVRQSSGCRRVLNQYGLAECMTRQCDKGISVTCGCGGGCGERLLNGGILIEPAGFDGGAGCGGRDYDWSQGPAHTLGHEMSHCRIGNDPPQSEAWRRAEEVGYACRGTLR